MLTRDKGPRIIVYRSLLDLPIPIHDRRLRWGCLWVLHNIVLRGDKTTQKPTALSLARQIAEPLQPPIFAVGNISAVLDVVPNTKHGLQQRVPDLLVIRDGVVGP